MLIANGDGSYFTGPLDVWCVLECDSRYHVAFLEESPPPGPILPSDEVKAVRLKSKMHHTEGHATLEEALAYLDETSLSQVSVPDCNVWREPQPWDGSPFQIIVPNWRKEPS